MSKTSRRKFTAEFKAKVAIEAIKEQQTIEALSKKYDLHPTQINTWKKEFLNNSSAVFQKEGNTNGPDDKEQLIQALYAQIGELKVANDFLKKKLL
jgi:transposase